MNNAPFHIGQRVVALKDSIDKALKKGRVVTVAGMDKCNCGCWFVHVAELTASSHLFDKRNCSECDNPLPMLNVRAGNAKYFAPITTRAVEIDEAIKEQAEEMIGVKETILTPVLS